MGGIWRHHQFHHHSTTTIAFVLSRCRRWTTPALTFRSVSVVGCRINRARTLTFIIIMCFISKHHRPEWWRRSRDGLMRAIANSCPSHNNSKRNPKHTYPITSRYVREPTPAEVLSNPALRTLFENYARNCIRWMRDCILSLQWDSCERQSKCIFWTRIGKIGLYC